MNFLKKVCLQILVMLFCISDFVYASQADYNIWNTILKLFFYIIVVILVLVITIYGTRIVAKNSRRFMNSKYIKVIDSLNLGTNIKILIVEISNYIYILVITNNSTEVVEKLSKEKFEDNYEFEEHLNKYKEKYTSDNEHLNKFLDNIKNSSKKFNKTIDKEEEDNEEN